ncbi:MAG: HIT family protein [bacterium]
MKLLWAPWRYQYIKKIDKSSCFLCKITKSRKDTQNLILFRGKTHFVVMNKFPYNNGHLMVAPYRHIADFSPLTPEESTELMHLISLCLRALSSALKPQGFNLGWNLGICAGAGLEHHLHLHIVPRWTGDTNFLPVLSDTKVISQHLQATYKLLKPHFSLRKKS